jgi:hypothetical protein
LGYLDIATLGTGAASKAVVLDAGEDYVWPPTGILTYGVLKDPAGTTLAATAAELNLLDGLNAAGSATASKPVVLDAGYAVVGQRRKVIVDADGEIDVDEAYSGAIITNEGAQGTAVFALGASVVGVELTFVVMTAQELRIDPNGTETIALPSSGAQGAAGKYLTANAVGEWVRLVCVKAGEWHVMGYAGTWEHESP